MFYHDAGGTGLRRAALQAKISVMQPLVFFDGECGFCQRSIQWVARHDAGRFAFAPIGGATFLGAVPPDLRRTLPDTMVVRAADGRVLLRGAAFRHLLTQSRWPWRAAGLALSIVPRALLDVGYDAIARRRHRLSQGLTCPIPPASFTERVLP
jgi:predicted DCC family thiol-disulfide oxidoreductase YuxK